jgi:hypothetical protein
MIYTRHVCKLNTDASFVKGSGFFGKVVTMALLKLQLLYHNAFC